MKKKNYKVKLKVKELLEERNITQKKLAQISGIRDGESLGGKTTAADDFGAVVDDDFLA